MKANYRCQLYEKGVFSPQRRLLERLLSVTNRLILLRFVGYLELHITLQYVRYGENS